MGRGGGGHRWVEAVAVDTGGRKAGRPDINRGAVKPQHVLRRGRPENAGLLAVSPNSAKGQKLDTSNAAHLDNVWVWRGGGEPGRRKAPYYFSRSGAVICQH